MAFIERPHCDLCGSPQKQTLLARPFADPLIADFLVAYYGGRLDRAALADAPYAVVRCRQCGFLWQQFVLDDAGMQALYDRWISAEESLKKRQGAASPAYGQQVDRIGAFFPQLRPADIGVLDFGMGWGYWCAAAQEAGYRVAGLELSETRIRHGREMGIEVIENLEGRQFDFINAEQVFEHIPAPLQTLRQLAGHLAPGGVVHIAVPDSAGIEHKLARPDWKPSNDALMPLEHINGFTRHTLSRLGKAAGLRVIHAPLLLTRKHGWKALTRGIAARYYRFFFGTGLYFRKSR